MLLFFQRDIGLRLFVLYLLFVGPLIIGALFVNNIAAQRLVREIQRADQDLASVITQEFQNYFGDLFSMVDQLAHHTAVANNDLEGMTELFQNVTIGRSNIAVIYLLNNTCTIFYEHQPGIGSEYVSIPASKIDSLCTANPTLTDGHISLISGQPVVTISHPIYSIIEQRTTGWVAIDVRLHTLNQLARLSVQHRPDEEVEVLILDAGEVIVARSDFNPNAMLIDVHGEIPFREAPVDEEGGQSWIASNNDDVENLYTSTSLPGYQWTVLLSRPTELAFNTPDTFYRGVIASVFIFIAVGFFFWIMLSTNVIRPLERLSMHSREIAQESPQAGPSLNLDVRETAQSLAPLRSRQDQIGHLVRSLLRAEEMIADRFKELETLLETGAVVLSSLDLRVVLENILEQVERLMGLEKSAIIALDEDRGIFRSQASRGLSQRYTEQIVIHPGEPASITLKALETGSAVQVEDTETEEKQVAYQPRARMEGIRAMIAVPLLTQHGPPTALLVYHSQPHRFTSREINLLTSFAQQAAMALENATLFNRSDVELQQQTLRLESLIQSLRDGLIMEDLDGKVLYINRMAEDLSGLSQFQAVGRDVDEILERIILLTREPEKTRAALHHAQLQEGNRQLDLELSTPQGTLQFLRIRIFDVTDELGVRLGRGRILHDITRRREIDRMRSSLVSTVSHELRTPLASIKGYATTLLSEDVEWDLISQREFLTIISEETDRLSELVKDLLDMSRIEAGNLSISRVATDLSEMVPRAAQRARIPPDDRLNIRIAPEVPPLYIDPQRIEVVFRNLIENAVKYSQAGTPILVTADREHNSIVIRVEDEGTGIPKTEHDRIFESFYRIENGFTRSTPGAGLGLAISQGFIKAHGGRIWYEERSKGSCFAFSLPLVTQEEKTE